MKKANTSFTPPRKGRPPKKLSKSGERGPKEKSTVKSGRDRSASVGRPSRAQMREAVVKDSPSLAKNPSANQKKRGASSPASSVGSSSSVVGKRRRTSTDSSTSHNERSSSRRASVDSTASRDEKRTSSKLPEPSLPKTGDKKLSKLLQTKKAALSKLQNTSRLKSLARAAKKNSDSKFKSSQKGKLPANGKVIQKKGTKTKVSKDGAKDPKGSFTLEMKRLSTTSGFWSTNVATSSSPRPGSEHGEPQKASQSLSKKTSRTSTPDVSPSSVRRKSLTTTNKEIKKEEFTSRSNIPMAELRRLETTEGFWSPNFTPMIPRTSSRDVSPSSTSSVDRGARQSTRSHSRGNDENTDDTNGPNTGVINKKNNKTDSSRTTPKAQDTNQLATNTLKKINTRTGDSKKVKLKEKRGEKNKTSASGKSALNVKLAKSKRLLQRTKKYVKGAASFSNKQQMRKTKENLGGHIPSPKVLVRKSPPKMKAEMRGVKRKFTDLTPRTSLRKTEIKDSKESTPVPTEIKEQSTDDSASSPELFISDLFKSPELKRLNTTPGFWAPIPNIGAVLGRPHSRRFQEGQQTSMNRQSRKNQLSPVKPQSSLLQHRKKMLHSLIQQQTMKRKRGRPRLNKEPLSTKQQDIVKRKRGRPRLHATVSSEPPPEEEGNALSVSSETVDDESTRKKRFVFGLRKRKGKKCFTPKSKVWLRQKDTANEEELSEPTTSGDKETPVETSGQDLEKIPTKTLNRGCKKLMNSAKSTKPAVTNKYFITRGKVKSQSSLDKSLDALQKVETVLPTQTSLTVKRGEIKTEVCSETKVAIGEKISTITKSSTTNLQEGNNFRDVENKEDDKKQSVEATNQNQGQKGGNLFEKFQPTLADLSAASSFVHSNQSVEKTFVQIENEDDKEKQMAVLSENDEVKVCTNNESKVKLPNKAVSVVEIPTDSTSELQVQLPTSSETEFEIATNSMREIEISTKSSVDVEVCVSAAEKFEISTDGKAEVEICSDSKAEVEVVTNTTSKTSDSENAKLISDANKAEVSGPDVSLEFKGSGDSSQTATVKENEIITLKVEAETNQNPRRDNDEANVGLSKTSLEPVTGELALSSVFENQSGEDGEKNAKIKEVSKVDSLPVSNTKDLEIKTQIDERPEETREPTIEMELDKSLNAKDVEVTVEGIHIEDVSLPQGNECSLVKAQKESSDSSTKEIDVTPKVDHSLSKKTTQSDPDVSTVDAAFQHLNVEPDQKTDKGATVQVSLVETSDKPSVKNNNSAVNNIEPEDDATGYSKFETASSNNIDKESRQIETSHPNEKVTEQVEMEESSKDAGEKNSATRGMSVTVEEKEPVVASGEREKSSIIDTLGNTNTQTIGNKSVLEEKELLLKETPFQVSSETDSSRPEDGTANTIVETPCIALQSLPSDEKDHSQLQEQPQKPGGSESPNNAVLGSKDASVSEQLGEKGNEIVPEATMTSENSATSAVNLTTPVSVESVAASTSQLLIKPLSESVSSLEERKEQNGQFSNKEIHTQIIPNKFQDLGSENVTNPSVLEASRVNSEERKKNTFRKMKRRKRKEMWKRGIVKAKHIAKKSKINEQMYIQNYIQGISHCEGPQSSGLEFVTSNTSDGTHSGTAESQGSHLSTNSVSLTGSQKAHTNAARIKKTQMLRRLQTNANLANAVLDESTLQNRFLRDGSVAGLNILSRRKNLRADPTVRDVSRKMTASARDKVRELRINIPGEGKRKRGRPRKEKNLDPPLPKLTPTDTQAPHNIGMMWDKAPPRLSPQITTPGQDGVSTFSTLYSTGIPKIAGADYVEENVDETDLHLYLSGASEDEPSPIKDSTLAASYRLQSVGKVTDGKVKGTEALTSNTGLLAGRLSSASVSTSQFEKELKSGAVAAKEPKRPGRKKMKGRRGRPPGTPMTEEEKKRKEQEKITLKMLSQVESHSSFKHPRTARKSLRSPSPFQTPSTDAGTPLSKFSLRKKSTRSPLEMLEMKRKKEEARYDLEEERRQARLFHLRERRNAKESGDGLSDAESEEEHLKSCSVVLNDFVKKLQLDSVKTFDGGDEAHHSSERPYSPESNAFDDKEDEDWCANLEDFDEDDDGEWSSPGRDKRPFIPRLKIKRVSKSGNSPPVIKSKHSFMPSKHVSKDKNMATDKKGNSPATPRVEPAFILPKPTQQVPIKLVIKSEPVAELKELGQPKTTSLDLSKMQRTGFEGSYLDFLTGKQNEDFMVSRANTTKRTYVATKPREGIVKPHGAGDVSLKMVQNSATEVSKNPVLHQRVFSVLPSTSGIGTNLSVGKATDSGAAKIQKSPSNTEPMKNFPSLDEEEEDMLILDLEDGATDQNSNDSNKDNQAGNGMTLPAELNNALDLRKSSSISVTGKSSKPSESAPKEDREVLTLIQPVPDNEEMGLMLQSYNENEDEPSPSSSLEDTTAKKTQMSDKHVSMNLTLGNKESSNNILPETQGKQDAELQLSGDGSTGAISSTPESSSLQPESSPGDLVKDLSVSETISKDNVSGQKGLKTTEETVVKGTSQQQSSPRQGTTTCPDMSQLASSDTDADSASPSTHENNNVLVAAKSPSKVVTPPKKAAPSSDSSKSPKHSTYIGSEPGEWKVKVILQSDKSPSGKYRCRRCNFTTPTKLTIESHVYSHIPGVQFRCAYCESEFSSMAATSTHLKNTHSVREAKLHISRHIEERNFYEKEDTVFSDEKSQAATTGQQNNVVQGGQSPPVIISVVVSGAVNSSRPSRSTAPSRRFVCTHCGFSTNVREDAEHHVLDLHPTDSLYACVLCREDSYYTEDEIKQHSATVHPSRSRSYRKLPDFYDVEHLKDERGNVFDRLSTIFQGDETEAETGTVDHRQKAKDYLYLQEYWKEKRSAEADSTTAVDYTEEHNEDEETTGPDAEVSEEGGQERTNDLSENEASTDLQSSSASKVASENTAVLNSTYSALDDADITSSAGPASVTSAVGNVAVTTNLSSQAVSSDEPLETVGAPQSDDPTVDKRKSPRNLAQPSPPTVGTNDPTPEASGPVEEETGPIDENVEPGPADDDMGLKIVQVVSLSKQNNADNPESLEHLDSTEEAKGTEAGAENSTSEAPEVLTDVPTTNAIVTESNTTVESVSQITTTSDTSLVTTSTSSVVTTTATLPTTTPTSAATSTAPSSSSATSASLAGGLPLSYKCNACKVHTPYLLMMVKHLKAKHPNMRCFACPYCKSTLSFVSQKHLRQHVKRFHPEKIERNEIALSEEAKKFVEAMVLPNSPECIRVGNRVVLEEHIHTCTYCQLKMTSLANVYEHLNSKHSDLFEFVCPVCQSFKSKVLQEISDHCQVLHKSSLDTDKVHVSVPKNLFTVLTCISKNGKYIEKTMDSGEKGKTAETSKSSSSSSITTDATSSQQKQKVSEPSTTATGHSEPHVSSPTPTVTTKETPPTNVSSETPVSAPISIPQTVPPLSVIPQTPLFAIPLVSGALGVGAISALQATRKPVAISSALFDTSSLTSPPLLVAAHMTHPGPVIQNSSTPSFLFSQTPHSLSSKQQSQLTKHLLTQQQPQASKLQPKVNPSKNLPVLNVPTVKPRASPSSSGAPHAVAKRPAESWSTHKKPPTPSSISPRPVTSISHPPINSPVSSLPSVDNLPEDEPNPDAFKIFNLRPNLPPPTPPAPPTVSPGMPTVYPPVSSPLSSDFIQGPMAGFPAGMVIPHHLLPHPYPFKQQSPAPSGMSQQRTSSSSRHSRLPHQSSLGIRSPSPRSLDSGASIQASAANTQLLKSQQQKELYLLKQRELQRQRMIKKHNQQQLMTSPQHSQRPASAHHQQSSTSSQIYQPMLAHPFDQQQSHTGPRHIPPSMSSFSSPPSPAVSTSPSPLLTQPSSSAHPAIAARPVKGIHKRSSSLYQCPYCPTPVTLRVLEVASHIQQHHPGKPVTFKKHV